VWSDFAWQLGLTSTSHKADRGDQVNFGFWIADFRLEESKYVNDISKIPSPRSRSNLKSKIENLKWVGIVAISFTFAMCGAVAQAQQAGKIPRIGFLDPSTASGSTVLWDSLREELRKLGWIEGKNIAFEYRFGENKDARVSALSAELVNLKVDLIVVLGRAAGVAAKNATTTIPIVMMTFPDPVREGMVASLARPGGNVTGLTGLNPELNTKRLEILKDVIPKLTRVGLLQPPTGFVSQMKELRAAAVELKLNLVEIQIEAEKGLEVAFETAKKKQVNAIVISGARRFFAERKRIVELAGKYRLPLIYPDKEFVNQGGLMSYGADVTDLYRRAAVYVDKILKGAKPGDLPVQQATKFEFVVNLKAAKQIDLTIPVRVLERANQVIK
jgi:putative ABC transport system substrate-binding protein